MQQALYSRDQAFCRCRVSRVRRCAQRVTGVACSQTKTLTVLTTREKGKNEKLQSQLLQKHRGVKCLELPLIEHQPGPDRAQLPTAIQAADYDWIAVTSPEAAAVFIEGWKEAGSPKVRVAVVGGGTGDILEAAGIKPEFTSSKALGKTMGSELPKVEAGSNVVLYPASAKASTDLQDSLSSSGFTVKRINTYDTRGVTSVDPHLLQQAMQADIITFGSPSAVKAWVALVGPEVAATKINVCIGSTSAKACKTAGMHKVFFPDAPGIDGWVKSILSVAEVEELIEPSESMRDM